MDDLESGRITLHERLELAAVQKLQTAEQNVKAKLDLLPFNAAARYGKGTDAILELPELRDGLACEPSRVVTRNALQRVLTLNDQRGYVGGREPQAADNHGY